MWLIKSSEKYLHPGSDPILLLRLPQRFFMILKHFFLIDGVFFFQTDVETVKMQDESLRWVLGLQSHWLVPIRPFFFSLVSCRRHPGVLWMLPWRWSQRVLYFNSLRSLSNKVSVLLFLCSDLHELSVEMSVEMPFEIRTLESPTHVIATKVTLTMQC